MNCCVTHENKMSVTITPLRPAGKPEIGTVKVRMIHLKHMNNANYSRPQLINFTAANKAAN